MFILILLCLSAVSASAPDHDSLAALDAIHNEQVEAQTKHAKKEASIHAQAAGAHQHKSAMHGANGITSGDVNSRKDVEVESKYLKPLAQRNELTDNVDVPRTSKAATPAHKEEEKVKHVPHHVEVASADTKPHSKHSTNTVTTLPSFSENDAHLQKILSMENDEALHTPSAYDPELAYKEADPTHHKDYDGAEAEAAIATDVGAADQMETKYQNIEDAELDAVQVAALSNEQAAKHLELVNRGLSHADQLSKRALAEVQAELNRAAEHENKENLAAARKKEKMHLQK